MPIRIVAVEFWKDGEIRRFPVSMPTLPQAGQQGNNGDGVAIIDPDMRPMEDELPAKDIGQISQGTNLNNNKISRVQA